MTDKPIPSLYTWAGGTEALQKLIAELYRRVPSDPLLAPLFAGMSPEHVAHVTAFIAEVFGGPKIYSEQHGGHPAMIRHHIGRMISQAQRKRWMELLFECADDLGVASDPEFRSSIMAYFEWGSRLAVINSQADAVVEENQPMPAWGWGETKGPYIP